MGRRRVIVRALSRAGPATGRAVLSGGRPALVRAWARPLRDGERRGRRALVMLDSLRLQSRSDRDQTPVGVARREHGKGAMEPSGAG